MNETSRGSSGGGAPSVWMKTQARALQPSCIAIVDQPRVAAHRDALAGGAQVRLGGDGVLVVAEVVADVGQQLDQGDAEVRRRAAPASRA